MSNKLTNYINKKVKYSSQIIIEEELVSKLEFAWNELYKQTLTDNVFISHSWVFIQGCLSNSAIDPYIIAVYDNNQQLVGLAPLGIKKQRRGGIKTRILSFLADGPSDYQDFIILNNSEEILTEIIVTLLDNKKDWDVIELKEFHPSSNNLKWLLKNQLIVFRQRKCSTCPKLDLTLSPFEQQIAKKTKQDVIYQLRRLEKNNIVKFCNVQDEVELNDFMSVFFEMHKLRWNTTKTPSWFNDTQTCDNFRLLASHLLKQGLASFNYLSLGHKIVACHWGLQSKDTLYYYIPAYDPAFAKNSISKVFLYLLIADAENSGKKTFDFLRGFESYKSNWGVTPQSNIQLSFVKSNLKGLISLLYLYYANNRRLFPFRVYRKVRNLITD